MIRLCSTALLVTLIVANLNVQLTESMADNVQVADSPLGSEYERAKRVYTHLISATYLRATAKLSLAKRVYQQILHEHETSAFVHTQLASLSIEIQDLPTTERECRRAIEIDPEKPTPYFLLGQTLIQRYGDAKNKDKWGDIIAMFQEVVKLDPDHHGFDRNGRPFSAYYYLGEISEQMGDYQSAANAFKELIRIMPYQPTFYLRLGSLYNQLENKQEAITAYERAIKINRDLWRAHEALGPLYVEQFDRLYREEQLVAAEENLQRAIHSYSALRQRFAASPNLHQYDSLLANFRTRLGSLYIDLRRENEAIAVLGQVLETDVDNVNANCWMGIAYQELGDFEKAAPYLKKAIALAPERVARLYFLLDKYKNVIEVLQKVLDDNPNNADANYWIGSAYQALEDFEKAESYLRKTIALSPEHEEAHNALGYLFADHGMNLDEAVKLIRKALKKSPANGAYLDSLGWAYFKQGKLNAALRQLERAVRYMPDSAEVQDHLGEVYLKKGLKKEAVSAWQKAIQLAPDNTAILEKLKKYQDE